MRKHILYLALLLSTSCGNLFEAPPLALPEATATGANTAGFRIGNQVIVPMANAFTRPAELGHSVEWYKLWMHISCYNERRNMKYKFSLELLDSLYEGGAFLANKGCDSYRFAQTFCVKLEDNQQGIIYYGKTDHAFELRFSKFELGAWEFAPYLIRGDTLYTHKRSVLAAGTFSGVLASTQGALLTVSDGRFDFGDEEWVKLEAYEIPN